ncbi:MAG: tetratricopeptide repeat protein [Pirellulaceae bacterium]
MAFRFQCRCGKQLEVTSGKAGTTFRCACGRANVVPPLSALRRHARGGEVPLAHETRRVSVRATSESQPLREFLMLLVPDHLLVQRISQESLTHFVLALDRTVKTFFEGLEPSSGFDIQVAYALLPDGNRLVEIETQPTEVDGKTRSELRARLRELAAPPVRQGPVAFASRMMIGGGSKLVDVSFGFPFSRLFQGQVGVLDDLLTHAVSEISGLRRDRDATRGHARQTRWHPTRGPLNTLRRLIRRLAGRTAAAGTTVCEAEPLPERTTGTAEATTVAECTRLILHHPNVAPLYGRRGDLYKHEGEYEPAIADYSKQLCLDPRNADALAARGECYCSLGNTKDGLADFSQAIRLHPRHVFARANRAMIYAELEAWKQALEDLSMAIAIDTNNPTLLVERGKVHVMDGNPDEALNDLSKALRLDPHNDKAYTLRGILERRCRSSNDAADAEVDQAILDFSAALQINPDNAQTYACRAEVLLGHSEFERAISDCDRALELDTQCALAWGVRGTAHQCLGNLEQAISDCTEAIQHGLNVPQVYVSRAVALDGQEEWDSALNDCITALELDPDYAAAYNSRGLVRMKLGELDEAIEDLTTAIRLEPDWCLPYFNRGNAHRMNGDEQTAITDFNASIEHRPDFAPGYLNRGIAKLESQEYDDAIRDLSDAVRLDEQLGEGFFHRGLAWGYKGEQDKALEDLNRALQHDPEFAPAYFTRANIRLTQGDHDRALEDFNELIRLFPDLSAAYTGRANVWIEKGERDKALNDYREAIQLDPGSAETYTVQRLMVEAAFHHRNERYAESISLANEAIELDEQCALAFATRAAAYWYSEQFVEAAADFTSLLRLGGDAFIAYSGRGQVQVELGEYEAALADLDEAIRMAEEVGETTGLAYTLCGRALVHAGIGRFEDSLRDFDRSIRLCPTNAWVYYNLALHYYQRREDDRVAICFRLALRQSDPPLTARKRARAKAYLEKRG